MDPHLADGPHSSLLIRWSAALEICALHVQTSFTSVLVGLNSCLLWHLWQKRYATPAGCHARLEPNGPDIVPLITILAVEVPEVYVHRHGGFSLTAGNATLQS
ncbi:hypothetical protein O181_104028 [Austropuccinia psidii MF-1]|uniref:Uncharacterized protein n=1 Tax=Austropuccinia psidii MF-1 TaxID=1389203 RepID=A0A9Q3JLF9_9BASI|nr:hypothetical protein [Austropuccinia psidii MF-1]